jgi:RNA polymerase sigma factor (sigma-70 family)
VIKQFNECVGVTPVIKNIEWRSMQELVLPSLGLLPAGDVEFKALAKQEAYAKQYQEQQALSLSAQGMASLEEMSDAYLVEQTLMGNQEVFAGIVERYKDAVQNLAYRMLGNVTEAEEVTQETFVRAYMRLATYKLEHKFSTWLFSISVHLSIDYIRRRRFLALPLEEMPFLERIADQEISPEDSALRIEQQDEVQGSLNHLPSKYRAVIVLRYWYDFSYEEIAQTLKLTPNLVKARLHQARKILARSLQQAPTQTEHAAPSKRRKRALTPTLA